MLEKIRGAYFPYCIWCVHDGRCRLKHHRFMGMNPVKGVDKIPYPGHEGVGWHLSGFQSNNPRGMCMRRICKTNSIFYPLMCSCGSAISSLRFSFTVGAMPCAKFFSGNEKEMDDFETELEKTKKYYENNDSVDELEIYLWVFQERYPDYKPSMMY